MKVSILGTGIVGQILSEKMIDLGHEVFMGTRDKLSTFERAKVDPRNGLNFKQWFDTLKKVNVIDFPLLPVDTDIFINATSGKISLAALNQVGKDKLRDKILIDLANPLDFSKGMPPSLVISNTDSLGETIQRNFPKTKVVKTFNTMNCTVMVNPTLVDGDHNIFMGGNDSDAKSEVKNLLIEIGWKTESIIDLGDIITSRATEMMLPLWVQLYSKYGNPNFNFNIVRSLS